MSIQTSILLKQKEDKKKTKTERWYSPADMMERDDDHKYVHLVTLVRSTAFFFSYGQGHLQIAN